MPFARSAGIAAICFPLDIFFGKIGVMDSWRCDCQACGNEVDIKSGFQADQDGAISECEKLLQQHHHEYHAAKSE